MSKMRGSQDVLAGILAAVVGLGLGGCDTWFGDNWFGESKQKLPGERISVLVHDRQLLPDPGAGVGGVLLPPPSPNPDWPQPGGYANHAMHHIAVSDDLHEGWRSDVGTEADDGERLLASPIVAGGRVFAMDAASRVSAYDLHSGKRLWREDVVPDDEDDDDISGGIAFEEGRVYTTTGFAEVVALNAPDGRILWRQKLGGPLRVAPTARGGRVFVVTVDNKVHALDGRDGGILWTHAGVAETASLLGGGSPAEDTGIVVVPFTSGELIALKVLDGRVLWNESLVSGRRTDVLSSISGIRGRPVIDRGRVFAQSFGGLLVALDLRTGRRIWDKEIGGMESPWVVGDYLFVISNNAELVCLGRDDGRIIWVTPLPRYEDEEDRKHPILWTGPILVSDRLIVAGSDGEALAVSPYTGDPLGIVEMPSGVSVPPIVAEGHLLFLTDGADLVAYR